MIRNMGSSRRSPYGWRFVYVTLEGVSTEAFCSVNKNNRRPGPLSLIPHFGERAQMEVLIECKERGLRPREMIMELRGRGIAEDCRFPGEEVKAVGLKDRIASFQEREQKLIDYSY
jgi:hypothetical protein